MNRTQDLEKVEQEIKDLSTRIEGIKFHIRGLKENMALMRSLRIQFEQNISVLKDEYIIAALHEFKKIREDLQTVNTRLNALTIDFNNHNVVLERSEKFLIELNEKYVMLLRNQDGRVIKGNFGGKK